MFDLQLSQSEYLTDLKQALLNEFDALYRKYAAQDIYAFALVLDAVMFPQFSTVSTRQSLLNENENKFQYLTEADQWNVSKWKYRADTHQGLSLLTRKMSKYFHQTRLDLTSISAKGRFEQNAFHFYLQGMQEAKDEILEKYHLTAAQISFLIYAQNDTKIAINSLERLNPSSSFLFEAIATLKSTQIAQGRVRSKLSQLDKEILIDLGQALEMVPYDDLQVAQQAYLLSLEPYFLETSPHIQSLINEIASIDSGILTLSKEEIQMRIRLLSGH